MALSMGTGSSITGLLVFGTATSLMSKIVYELEDPRGKFFLKPWAMVTVMFMGMSLSLPLAYLEEFQAAKQETAAKEEAGASAREPLLNQESGSSRTGGKWREVFMLSIPTVFDLFATILMNIGLISVQASVYQMLRGAEMLFAALFAVLFLQRRLNKYHFGGISLCILGITLVGVASILSDEGSQAREVSVTAMLTGMGLIVASQSVQAAQITFEDYFMADLHIAPLKIVGIEGVWGCLAMLVILPVVHFLPGKDGMGFHEDTLDTIQMIKTSPAIATILGAEMLALLMYNLSGMCVTGHLGAVFRTVLETMRTLFVWVAGLILFYTPLGMGRLGESWNRGSYVQAAGFLVLVTGTLIYGRGDEEEARQEGYLDVEADGALEVAHETPSQMGSAHSGGTSEVTIAKPAQATRTQPINMSPSPSVYKSTMSLAAFSPASLSRSQLGNSYTGPSPFGVGQR